ncbi:MAG: hypothetical protein AB1491_00295 [Thermodesulfobacteriota bacterium]
MALKPMKIPVSYAQSLGLDKSHLVRVNQGKRRLSWKKAIKLVEITQGAFHLLDLLPELEVLIPYLCQPRKKVLKKLRKKSPRKEND